MATPVLLGLMLAGMFWLASERTIYQRVQSPDQKIEARVQFDDAGAATGWAKVVYIRPKWIPLDTPQFSCRAFWGDGTNNVKLIWTQRNELQIRHGFRKDEVMELVRKCSGTWIVSVFDPTLVSADPDA